MPHCSDTLHFDLANKKCGDDTELPSYGTTVIFPQDSLAVGFIYGRRQNLANESAGVYVMSDSYTFLGASVKRDYAKIAIWEFTYFTKDSLTRYNNQ
jgi:hypothetical protein